MSHEDPPVEPLLLTPAQCSAMADELRHIEDELTYIIECLLQDLTGESKSSLSALATHVDAAPALPSSVATHIATRLRDFRQRLIPSVITPQLTIDIAGLRRSMTNTVAMLCGMPRIYSYREPLLPPDTVLTASNNETRATDEPPGARAITIAYADLVAALAKLRRYAVGIQEHNVYELHTSWTMRKLVIPEIDETIEAIGNGVRKNEPGFDVEGFLAAASQST